MNPYSALATTIVAGVLALGLIVSITVLLVSSVEVPKEFPTTLVVLIGVAVGGASKASSV